MDSVTLRFFRSAFRRKQRYAWEALKDGFLEDFAEFERLGVVPKERKADAERIKAMLKEE